MRSVNPRQTGKPSIYHRKKKSINDMIKNGQRDLIRPRLYGHSLQGRILGNFIKRVNKLKTENVR